MAKENTIDDIKRPLGQVIQEFVLLNCFMQTAEDQSDGGVAIPYIVSKPGAGKTAIIADLCKKHGYGLLSLHFALKPIEELGGIPEFTKIMVNGREQSGTTWTVTDIITSLWNMHNEKKEDGKTPKYNQIILLYDDAHLCGPGHMAFFYEPFTERTMRGYEFPPNVSQIMAGNDSNKAGAKAFFSAITNRCARLPTYATFDDWKSGFALKKLIHPAVVSFLGKDVYQHSFFHGDEVQDTPWPSPRSWSRFANYLKKYESLAKDAMPADMVLYYGEAHIGKDAASEFSRYYSVYTKFNLEAELAKGEKFRIPEDDINKYALAFALIAHYCGSEEIRKSKLTEFSHVVYQYIKNAKEIGIVILKDLIALESHLNDNTIFSNVSKAIDKIEKDCTTTILSEASQL